MRMRMATVALGLVWLLWQSVAFAQMFNVTFLHTPAAKIVQGQDLLISGNIVGADQVSIAALAFRVGGQGDFEVRELKLLSGDVYEGVIPGARVKTPVIEYYCYAVDFEGNRLTVFASEQEPQKVPVVAPEAVLNKPKPIKPVDKPKGDKPGKPDASPVAPTPADIFASEDFIELATGDRRQIAHAPAMASVLAREQIAASGARTVAELLDQVPGISVARSVSGEYRLAMRGNQSNPEIMILLDGHRQNDPYAGSALLEFPAEAVERIEVIRGPSSALYGTGAFIGLINIVTRQSSDLHARVAYGQFNQVRVSAGGGYDQKAFSVGGQVQFIRSDGHDSQVENDVLTGVEGTTQTSKDDVSNTPGSVDDGRMQIHAQLQSSLKGLGDGELSFLGHYFYQTRGGYVGKFDSLDLGSELDVHRLDLDLRFGARLSDMFRIDSRAYFDTQFIERAFQVIRAPEHESGNSYLAGSVILRRGLKEIDAYQTMTAGAELSTSIQLLKNNTLAVGIGFEYQSLPTYTQERDVGSDVACTPCAASEDGCVLIQGFELPCGSMDAAPSGSDRIMFGFLLQDHWTDLLPGLDLLAGIRLDYFTDFGLTYNPRVAVIYGPIEQLQFKVVYSQAFRAPTFRELYDDAQFDPLRTYQGKDDLKPVRIDSLEIGVESHLETQPVVFRLRANFFINWIDDAIQSVDQGTGLASWDNVESLFVMGTEVEGIARFGERNRVYVNSSWFRAEVKVAGQPDASYITDVPQMRLNLGADLALMSFLNLHLGLRYGSERRNNVRQRLELLRSFELPAYSLVRVGLSTEPIFLDHLVVFATAYNVFDQDVRDPPPRPDHISGYVPRSGFTFLVGIAWRP